MGPRFLDSVEMEALKFAIGFSNGLRIDECHDRQAIGKHFLAPGTHFMYYDTGEGSVCVAWVLGDEDSFCEYFVHEEVHRVLHQLIDLRTCCDYDNVARFAEATDPEPKIHGAEILVKVPERAGRRPEI